jgi:hypothetical protein
LDDSGGVQDVAVVAGGVLAADDDAWRAHDADADLAGAL